ncbi:hypothetical protein QBD01_004901 [Ochrobactrum sp. 19YEA23]|uniref:hypothetical protein n=1 Tax=Ochrobactrum sp. 19YEA23 TaxID=3039854 RepID=UPI00247843D5|nr:hypothetical protein [Ochrobactrum sp. 19YEA23]
MSFIELKSGVKIVADHITHFNESMNTIAFHLVDGTMIYGTPTNEEFETALYRVLPAAPGFSVIYRYAARGKSYAQTCPVVAWREYPGGVYPISVGYSRDLDDQTGLVLPDGSVIDGDGNLYESVDALIADIDRTEAEMEKLVSEAA